MWNILKSDLKEFVTAVTVDTSQALSRIDDTFPDSADDEEDNNAATSSPSSFKDDDNVNKSAEGVETADESLDYDSAEEEMLRRMALPETYTTPLRIASSQKKQPEKSTNEIDAAETKGEKANSPDGAQTDDEDAVDVEEEEDFEEGAEEFLESFSIESKTDDIADLLEQYPETLKVHFETLVPTEVSYEDFWKRFYFRCDTRRIALQAKAEEDARAAARAQAVSMTIGTVRNFFGGAVQAVSKSLAEVDDGVEATRKTAVGGVGGFFGGGARPPFVMNTALDEDDDEEEAELGWDDDDEDVDVDEDLIKNKASKDTEEDNRSEHIEFNDAATEQLQEQLKQALEERDQLHQTVKMQAEEIAALKGSGSSKEVEDLKMKLFERESELAAVRAKLADNDGHSHDDAALEQLTAQLQNERDAAESKILQLEQTVSSLKQENAMLQKQAQLTTAASNSATDALHSEIAAYKEQLAFLTKELQAAKSSEAAARLHADSLEIELKKAKEVSASEERSVASPSGDTVSTGIKVDSPVVTKLDGEKDDVGWDDDW